MKGVLEKGLTLVELMIALFLGSILLLGLTQLVISSSSLGAVNRNLANNQMYANSILDTIGVEIRLAGYQGCGPGGEFSLAGGLIPTDLTKLHPVVPILSDVNDASKGIGMHLRFAMDVNSIDATSEPFPITQAKLSTQDCLDRDLYWRGVEIRNCAINSICINKFTNPITEQATKTVIPNATIQEMVFSLETGVGAAVRYEDRIIGKTATNPVYTGTEFDTVTDTLKEFLNTTAITIVIEITTPEVGGSLGAEATMARSYSATYNLRNLR